MSQKNHDNILPIYFKVSKWGGLITSVKGRCFWHLGDEMNLEYGDVGSSKLQLV
jgi:hypothetical protein